MLIIYSNDDEVIITTASAEKKAIKEWFTEGDRDIGEYDREVRKEGSVGVSATSRVRLFA